MGRIIYDSTTTTAPDEVVARADAMTQHLLREGIGFTLIIEGVDADGQSLSRAMWMAPEIAVQFTYHDFETVKLDRESFAAIVDRVRTDLIYDISGADVPLPYEFTGDDEDDSADE